jgi:hypothetical protein
VAHLSAVLLPAQMQAVFQIILPADGALAHLHRAPHAALPLQTRFNGLNVALIYIYD